MKKLTKEEQIEWVEKALEHYKYEHERYGISLLCGLCFSFKETKTLIKLRSYKMLPRYIKGFNITNAKKLAKKYGFSEPTGQNYWWLSSITKPRIKFMEALINELKNN